MGDETKMEADLEGDASVREHADEQSEERQMGETTSFNFLRAPTHVQTLEDAADWLEGDVGGLIRIASQLADPHRFRGLCTGEAPTRPADPKLLGDMLDDLYSVTLNLADVLRGRVLPQDLEPARVTSESFASLLAEAERIRLDDGGLSALVSMVRAAVDAEAKAQARSRGPDRPRPTLTVVQ